MKILVVDNNVMPDSYGSDDLVKYGKLIPGSTVFVRRGPHHDLPAHPTEFDRIILSGSLTGAEEDAPWVDALMSFIRETVDRGVPLFGVCYGHQMIARALGGKQVVGKNRVPEFGWTEVEIIEQSPLFEGLENRFHSFSYHYDCVKELPAGFRLLARSEDCEIQAYTIQDKPVFGIQFHPEKPLGEEDEAYLDLKKKGLERYFRHPKQGKKLYRQSVGDTLFSNFFKLRP